MKKEKEIDEKIMEMVMQANLGYFETIGMLEHIKSELIRMNSEEHKKQFGY